MNNTQDNTQQDNTQQEPSFVADTLAWCNERRKEKGMEPLDKMPKGRRFDTSSCPCGRACGIYVGYYVWSEPLDGKMIQRPLPKSVGTFAREFDKGSLPQYEERY